MKQWMIIGAIALVLILAYSWNRSQENTNTGEEVPPVEEIITQEDGTVVKRIGEEVQELTEADMQTKKQEIDEKVKDAPEVILNPETGAKGTGSSKTIYQDGNYYQKLTVSGVPALEKGYYYEAWLQKTDGSRVSIGRLEMTTQTSGQLYYQAQEDRSGTSVLITKQAEGQKETGEVVLKQ